jgi:hypothetical protein
VGAVGGAALSCYMVSLRVATERADLAHVERQIVDTRRDIRTLQTELGTRGRLTQLEDWNSNVLALSAPTSSQFVKNGYQLAQLATHGSTVEDRANNVRLAALDTGQAAAPAKADGAAEAKAPAAAAKPARPAPAAPAHDAAPMPRMVEAVAPAPHDSVVAPVRRASFETIESPAAPKAAKPQAGTPSDGAPKPAKKARVAKADPAPPSAKKPKPATAGAARPPKVRTAARAGHPKAPAEHAGPRTAHADAKPKPAAKHAPARLARADAPAHPQSSGHRGGAQ